MDSLINRRAGAIKYRSPHNFTINNRGIIISPEIPVTKRTTPVKFKNHILNKSKNSIIAKGKIVPDDLNYHEGSLIFQFPNNEKDVLNILRRMFVTDKVLERIHDYCGFIKHYHGYTVFIREKRLGIISEILNN